MLLAEYFTPKTIVPLAHILQENSALVWARVCSNKIILNAAYFYTVRFDHACLLCSLCSSLVDETSTTSMRGNEMPTHTLKRQSQSKTMPCVPKAAKNECVKVIAKKKKNLVLLSLVARKSVLLLVRSARIRKTVPLFPTVELKYLHQTP